MPGYNQYIGMRYVPLIDGAWSATKTYEPLVIVSYEGNSYISKTFVPAGTPVSNETYWMLSANYNAQVEQYRQEVRQYQQSVDGIAEDVSQLQTDVLNLDSDIGNIDALLNAGFEWLGVMQGDYLSSESVGANGGAANITAYADLSNNARVRRFKELYPNGQIAFQTMPPFINFGCCYSAATTPSESGSIAGDDYSLTYTQTYNVRNLTPQARVIEIRTRTIVLGYRSL